MEHSTNMGNSDSAGTPAGLNIPTGTEGCPPDIHGVPPQHGVPHSDGRRFQCADGNAVRRRNSRQRAELSSAQIRAAIRSTQSARMSTHTRYSEYSRSAHTKLLYLLTQRGEGACVRTGGTFWKQCLRRRVHDSAALRSELRVLRRKRGNCCLEVRVRRREVRVRRRKLFIPRRQFVDLSGVPASCTPRLVPRCEKFV